MRLKIQPINKPVKDYDKEKREYEALLAKLPPELLAQHREREAEERAEYEAKHEREIAERDLRFGAWLEARGLDEPAEDDLETPARFCTDEDVDAARRRGLVAAAVEPVSINAFELWLIWGPNYQDSGPFAKCEKAARLRLPLAIGEGSITLVIESEKVRSSGYEGVFTHLVSRMPFEGTIDGEYVTGALVQVISDMELFRIELSQGSQEIADKLARYFDRLFAEINLPEDLSAILAPSKRCFACGRPLDDPISKALWIGPTCAKNLGVPHNSEAVRIIAEKRRTFICDAGRSPDVAQFFD